MRLGVNFCHDDRQPIGFNRDAVLALRPPVVRFAITADQVGNLYTWIQEAERQGLQVLWSIPESLSLPTARTVARIIASHGVAATAGVEIGFAPWAFNRTPVEFLAWAWHVAELLQWTAKDATFSRERPVILGLGYDGSPEASGWYRAFHREVRQATAHQPAFRPRRFFHAVGVNATAPGRRFRRFLFRAAQGSAMDRWQLPLAFTRVGWQLGQPLEGWTHVREAFAAGFRSLPPHGRMYLSAELRRRWLIDAYECASKLGAIAFILEPDLLPLSAGLNRWPLYDGRTGRVDTVWHVLQWRAARAVRPLEPAPH